jgi:hypothetical protein
VFDALGFEIGWNDATKEISITKTRHELLFTLGSHAYSYNNNPFRLDIAPYVNPAFDRTMLPLSGPLHEVGYGVDWHNPSRTVLIDTKDLGEVKVTVNLDGFRFRDGNTEPNMSHNNFPTLTRGITLTTLNPVQTHTTPQNTFIKVIRDDNGREGWVAIRNNNQEVLAIRPMGDSGVGTLEPGELIINNNDYRGLPILTTSDIEAVRALKSFYEHAAPTYNIPWQMLAAIHYREYRFKKEGPRNGDGPYQIWNSSYPIGLYTDEQFQKATNDAAAFIRGKAENRDLSNMDNIKFTFFAYNGAASIYRTQAINLGFTDAQSRIGEGSPYVMNRYDLKRDPTVEPTKSNDTWGQFKRDGVWPGTPGTNDYVYPSNNDYGAYIIFKALGG